MDQFELTPELKLLGGVRYDVFSASQDDRLSDANDFGRIAVLTDSQWVTWSAWLSQVVVSADLRVFQDEEDARTWLAGVGE